MTRRRLTGGIAVAAFVAVLTGCSQTEGGSATPAGSASASMPPSSSTASGGAQVPQVQHPLDASPYTDDPCALVPQTQMESRGYLEPGTRETAASNAAAALAGPGCTWNSEGTELLAVVIQTGNRDQHGTGGLQGVYEAYEGGLLAFLEPASVGDYPAAFTGTADRRSEGNCMLVVGVADNLSFSVVADGYLDDPSQACTDVESVAGTVIETLKDGS